MENKINIIVPFYNAEKYIERCLFSLVSQRYENFHIYVINDASTDNSKKLLNKFIDNKKITIINNDKNLTALPNIHNTIINFCEPESIVALVDGDDSLANSRVLKVINKNYNEKDCWIHYGSALWVEENGNTRRGFESMYPENEYKEIEKAPFRVSHLRTFRSGVYHKIKEQDPNFNCMKDENGEFYRSGYDTAIMFRLFNLTPYERVFFCNDVLYHYNFSNPISDHRVDQALQTKIDKCARNKKPFKQIQSYK